MSNNQFVTPAIMLGRLDYGEADRIITFITPEHGKLTAMAKGVRREKSKLAGGIELFSESQLTLLKGRSEMYTLVSSHLLVFWEGISKDLKRTMLGYDILRIVQKIAADGDDHGLYPILRVSLEELGKPAIPILLCECWFYVRMLEVLGHSPRLDVDVQGEPLDPAGDYSFSFGDMAFFKNHAGEFSANHLKLLKLMHKHSPEQLCVITHIDQILQDLQPLTKNMLNTQLDR